MATEPTAAPHPADVAPEHSVAPRPGSVTPGRALAGLLAFVVAVQAWWVWRNRNAFTVDQDEAAILLFAFDVRRAGGPGGLWDAWVHHPDSAPLLGTVTGLASHVLGTSPVALLVPVLAALVVLGVAVWWIARELGSSWAGVAAAALVVTSPIAVYFSRTVQQIVPAAAALAACVALGLRSDLLARRRASVALGAAAGVALLVRAMLLPLAPASVVLALLVGLTQGRRRERLVNAAVAVGCMVAVGATWWAFQWRATTSYLTGGALGRSWPPATSLRAWTEEARLALRVVGNLEAYDLRWLLWLTLVGLGAWAVVATTVAWPAPRRARAVYVAGVAAAAFVTLGIERDNFPGYELIAVPLAVALAAACLAERHVLVRRVAAALVAALAVQAVVWSLSPRATWLVWGSDSHAPAAAAAAGRVQRWGDTYVDLNRQVALRSPTRTGQVLVYDIQVATRSLQYASARGRLKVAWAEPAPDGWDEASLRHRLARSDGTVFVTVPTDKGQHGFLDVDGIVAELRSAGCRVADRVPVPDGRTTSLWTCPG